jgi:hypothetical protein
VNPSEMQALRLAYSCSDPDFCSVECPFWSSLTKPTIADSQNPQNWQVALLNAIPSAAPAPDRKVGVVACNDVVSGMNQTETC